LGLPVAHARAKNPRETDISMVIEQRRSPADKLILRMVLPAIWRTPLQPLGRAAALWHKEVPTGRP